MFQPVWSTNNSTQLMGACGVSEAWRHAELQNPIAWAALHVEADAKDPLEAPNQALNRMKTRNQAATNNRITRALPIVARRVGLHA